MAKINYPTKFNIGEVVHIERGFYQGHKGSIVDYGPTLVPGLIEDFRIRKMTIPDCGLYEIKLSTLKTVYVLECDLRGEYDPGNFS